MREASFKHSSVCLHHQALGTITRGRQTLALNQRSKQKITRQNVYCETVLAITTKNKITNQSKINKLKVKLCIF